MTALEIAGSNLLELALCCESATGPDRQLDLRVAKAVGSIPDGYKFRPDIDGGKLAWGGICGRTVPAFTASLDAVATLLPSWAFPLLDWRGCHCRLRNSLGIDFPEYTGLAPTPARAMLAAVLRCLAAQKPVRSLLKGNSDANG